MPATMHLKAGREKSLKRRHPWVFSGAIDRVDGEPQPGETIQVMNSDGQRLALAAYSPESQIQARIWKFGDAKNPIKGDSTITADFFAQRITAAKQRRIGLGLTEVTNGYRLISSESDDLPGLIIDHYANYLVLQFLSQGTEFWRDDIIQALRASYPEHNIYERSDVAVREKEGLAKRQGLILGDEPEDSLTIEENGYKLGVDIKGGHKTGFYLDQRDSRKAIQKYVKDKSVLNCFSYTGGFSVSALSAGAAHVTNIDESLPALNIAKANIELNGLNLEQCENIEADVFKHLRLMRDQGKQFDVIILDPPKFADNKSQLKSACRGYKDINLWALKLLKPGGILATFSCSGLISPELFQQTLGNSAIDAGRNLRIIERLNQGADHPTSIFFPEGHYLKGFICQVD